MISGLWFLFALLARLEQYSMRLIFSSYIMEMHTINILHNFLLMLRLYMWKLSSIVLVVQLRFSVFLDFSDCSTGKIFTVVQCYIFSRLFFF